MLISPGLRFPIFKMGARTSLVSLVGCCDEEMTYQGQVLEPGLPARGTLGTPSSGRCCEQPRLQEPQEETASHLLCLKESQIKALTLCINFATDGSI